MKKKLFKNMYVLTGKDMSTAKKVYPYYSEEEYRMMTNDDIINKLTLLKKQKDKSRVDVNALNCEMQELKRELEKRSKKVLIREVEQYVECCDDINNKKLVIQVENIIKFLENTKEILTTEEIADITSATLKAVRRIRS